MKKKQFEKVLFEIWASYMGLTIGGLVINMLYFLKTHPELDTGFWPIGILIITTVISILIMSWILEKMK